MIQDCFTYTKILSSYGILKHDMISELIIMLELKLRNSVNKKQIKRGEFLKKFSYKTSNLLSAFAKISCTRPIFYRQIAITKLL